VIAPALFANNNPKQRRNPNMATPFIAYLPYAAAAYCVAKVAQAAYPSLRSQMSSVTHYSTPHGMDGEDPIAMRMAEDCSSLAAVVAADNFYVRNAPPYCYDMDSNTIVGDGNLDGVHPPMAAVSVWQDEDGTTLATISVSGDATITIPACGGPSQIPPPDRRTPPGVPQPPGEGGRPPLHPHPLGDPGECGRRPPILSLPQWSRATCGPAERNQQLARVRLRNSRGW